MKMALLFLLGGAVFTSEAVGGASSSQDYGITADVVDAGGGFSSSPNYAATHSLGETAGGMSDESPAGYVGRHGFIGQLADAVSLTLTLSPSPIDEASTGQLSAVAVNDDATFDPLSPSTVTWSIVSGPVASISSSGEVTTMAIYVNKPATIQGNVPGLTGQVSFTIVNTQPDNYGTYAGDGIDDGWQVGYFGQNNPEAGPAGDPDGDGNTNMLEWLAGLVPTDPASVFLVEMTQPTHIPGRASVLFGPIVPGRSYQVLWSDDLASWHKLDPQSFSEQDLPPNRVLTDNGAPDARRFYRVIVSKP